MGNKNSKEKSDSSKVSGKNARKGPLPEIPTSNEVIPHGVRTEKPQDSENSYPKDEFSAGAKVYLVLHDFDAIGHNTVSVKKNEKVELRNQAEVWSDVYIPRLEKNGWIPSNYLAPLNSMSRYPWYHKQITRSTAEWLLRNGINGSYLVRESESTAGQYSLSVRHEGKKYHYRIQSRGGRYWIHEESQFKDLAELIHHHSQKCSGLITLLTHPVPNESKPAIDILTDEWEIDRNSITLGEKLGCGQYGEVYKGEWFRDRTSAGIPIAVKTLKSDSASQEEFLKEAALMKRLKHENLLHLLGVCTLQKPFFIITEYMPLGNLLEYIRNYREQMTSESLLHAASQIAAGMCFLEKENLVHRDLACRNCLVGENLTIRICDFGLSRLLDEDSYTAREGTKFPIKWTAPEALNYNTFTMKSDVWSFGIVLWELATRGETPYPSIDLQEVLGLLETGYRMKRPDGCPEQVYKLMSDCWDWEPDKRPTFADITVRLENMFTTNNPSAALEFLTTTSVEEEVQRTLEEDIPSSSSSSPRSTSPRPSTKPKPLNQATTPVRVATPTKNARSKSAPVEPSAVNIAKGLDMRSRAGNSCSNDMSINNHIMNSSGSPGNHSGNMMVNHMQGGLPPRHMVPPKGANKYSAFDHQLMEQQGKFYNPYPQYPQQHLVRPGNKKIRHQMPQMSQKQLQQIQQQQQQAMLNQQMQQIKLQQQQQQLAERQRIAHQQHQEMWLKKQQRLAQSQHNPQLIAHSQQHMANNQQHLIQNQHYPAQNMNHHLVQQQLQPNNQHLGLSNRPLNNQPRPLSTNNISSSSMSSPSNQQHLIRHPKHLQSGDKHRTSSECSSASSSTRYDTDRTPGNASPASTVSSGSGTDLLSELKSRQSRLGDAGSKIPEVAASPIQQPSPKNPNIHSRVDPGTPNSRGYSPGTPTNDHKALPAKPPGLARHTNGTSSNFCAVNPTKSEAAPTDKTVNTPPGRRSPAEEDFSFEAVLNRAKGNEAKSKPVPPPKPKINLT